MKLSVVDGLYHTVTSLYNSVALVFLVVCFFVIEVLHLFRMWDMSYVNNMPSTPINFLLAYLPRFLLRIACGRSEFGMKIKA